MYFEWWMILIMAGWWFISVRSICKAAMEVGGNNTIEVLLENGFIELDENDEIVGLCNSDKLKSKK